MRGSHSSGADPFDMSGLSDAERAAMRHEWSLECRRAGLDHLAESFKKPSVLNPRDEDVLPYTDPRDHPNPIASVVERVTREDLTDNLDAKLAFLNGEGAAGVAHTGNGKFDAHLVGVACVLRAWGCDDSVVDAGLFHSIYGTEGFQGFCLPYERRDDVRALIGDRAERLVHTFCVVDRLSVDNDLDSRPEGHGFKTRPELSRLFFFDDEAADTEAVGPPKVAAIDLDDALWFDFVTLTLADWLEQVEGAANATNGLFHWFEKGDAWGYRRGAYERMSEIVGAKIPAARALWEAVYAREHPGTRHKSQPVTPPMSDAARIARAGIDQPQPRYP